MMLQCFLFFFILLFIVLLIYLFFVVDGYSCIVVDFSSELMLYYLWLAAVITLNPKPQTNPKP